MPKFFVSVITSAVLLWGFLIYLIFSTQPSSYINIFLFLMTFFLAMGITLSIPLYFFFKRKLNRFEELKILYRKSFKWGMIISFGITGVAFLKALGLLNLLNFGLFLLLYAGILYHTLGKK